MKRRHSFMMSTRWYDRWYCDHSPSYRSCMTRYKLWYSFARSYSWVRYHKSLMNSLYESTLSHERDFDISYARSSHIQSMVFDITFCSRRYRRLIWSRLHWCIDPFFFSYQCYSNIRLSYPDRKWQFYGIIREFLRKSDIVYEIFPRFLSEWV